MAAAGRRSGRGGGRGGTRGAAHLSHRARLRSVAIAVMRSRDLRTTFPAGALRGLLGRRAGREPTAGPVRDLRDLHWISIDNDDSRDLDQLSWAERLPGGWDRVLVAVADVDRYVPKGSPLDLHAEANTTSVYMPGNVFPMLPDELSHDLTSLNPGEDRHAIVVEFSVDAAGQVRDGEIFRAQVQNRAQLAYDAVSEWLVAHGDPPPAADERATLEQLALQDEIARRLEAERSRLGALDLEGVEVEHLFEEERLSELRLQRQNRARLLIANLMIVANGVTARFLATRRYASIQRVVRIPERWERIRALAAEHGDTLSAEPSSAALAGFLARRRSADPEAYPDLSTTVIKLLGRGEYVMRGRVEESLGHFGLAVRDYMHSTAPNRRYPDLITQRIVKAAIDGRPSPYKNVELLQLAKQCTEREDAVNRAERHLRKSAAALVLEQRIGERFDAIVSGVSAAGVFVRISRPPAEGMLVDLRSDLDVGDRLAVRLAGVNVERGFIDFEQL